MTILVPHDLVQRLTVEAKERGLTVAEFGGLCVAAWVRSQDQLVSERGLDGLEQVDQYRDQ